MALKAFAKHRFGAVFCATLMCATLMIVAPRVSAQAPDAASPPDLQKQIDDALKELNKLEKSKPEPQIVPEAVDPAQQQNEEIRNQLRQRQFQAGAVGNPLFIQRFGGAGRAAGQARFGVIVQRLTPVLAEQLKIDAAEGLMVLYVVPESPAAKAGIARTDVLVEIDGKPLANDPVAFQQTIAEVKPATEISATIVRRGQKETIKGIKLNDLRADANVPLPFIVPGGPRIQQGPFPEIQIFQPGGNRGLQLQTIVNGAEAMRIQVANEKFTILYSLGDLRATVIGARADGKTTPSVIRIQDGEANVTANTLNEVPERYRATIARMLDSVK